MRWRRRREEKNGIWFGIYHKTECWMDCCCFRVGFQIPIPVNMHSHSHISREGSSSSRFVFAIALMYRIGESHLSKSLIRDRHLWNFYAFTKLLSGSRARMYKKNDTVAFCPAHSGFAIRRIQVPGWNSFMKNYLCLIYIDRCIMYVCVCSFNKILFVAVSCLCFSSIFQKE